MVRQFGHFIQRQSTSFIGWAKLLFADDDERRLHPDAPTMKNVILFVLLVVFCVSFLKVVYLMEVTVRHEIRANVSVKSTQVLDSAVAAPDKTATQDLPDYSFQVPDIPSNWMTVFLAGLGIMAGLSGAKKIAEYKYGNGNGKNGNGNGNGTKPEDQPKV